MECNTTEQLDALNVNFTGDMKPLNVISSGEMEAMVTDEINTLFAMLVRNDITNLEEQIAIQSDILTTAAREKYKLQQELALKKKELESYTVTKPEIITISDSPPPSPVIRLKADKPEIPYQSKCHEKDCQEFIPIEYDLNDYPKSIIYCMKHKKCRYHGCSNYVTENSDYCAIPSHDYDGFAQRLPSPCYNAEDDVICSPSLNTTTPIVSSTPNVTTPADQGIPIRSKPPKIKKKRSYVFKCFERSCSEPEIEGTYFCGDHYPCNQLGRPDLFNKYYGISKPIKRQKIYIPIPKKKKPKSKSSKSRYHFLNQSQKS